MHDRGNKRAGPLAKFIMALIAGVAIAAVAFGVFSMRNEPETVPGSQVIPGQAAKRAGALPRPSP